MKYLFGILLFISVFSFQPFSASAWVPSFVRVGALAMLFLAGIALNFKKKDVFRFLIAYACIGALLCFFWLRNSPKSLSDILFVLLLIGIFLPLKKLLRRIPGFGDLIISGWLYLYLVISLGAILSCIAFNFNLLPYSAVELGEYKYYFNFLLGYIHVKNFNGVIIGRPTGFMLEPSYLAAYLTTNFFLLRSFYLSPLRKQIYLIIGALASLATFSTAVWLVFGIFVLLYFLNKLYIYMGFGSKAVRNTAYVLLGSLLILMLIAPQELVNELLGKSSFDDRIDRLQTSAVILSSAGPLDILFGHSPGYIEHNFLKGESNQYIKLFIEEGFILFVFFLGYFVFISKRTYNYMLSTLIFLNSVVILFTPLFFLNVLVCDLILYREYKTKEPNEL